nr:hypothetical protein [Tanacetum cinerariifolium]
VTWGVGGIEWYYLGGCWCTGEGCGGERKKAGKVVTGWLDWGRSLGKGQKWSLGFINKSLVK